MIFSGAYYERNIKNEYRNNFFIQNQTLFSLDTISKKLEIVEKMDFEKYKNEKFINKITCMSLKKDKQDTKNNTKDKHLIVYFGGNGETIYYSFAYGLFNEFSEVKELNVDFLIIGFPGYACDSSKPTADNFYKYSDYIAQYISSSQTAKYQKIHFLAFSIGCAMAIDSAIKIKKNKLSSVTLINPFTNIKDCARHIIKKKMTYLQPFCDKILKFIENDFDNLVRIKELKCKCLNIIFSSNDTVINNDNSKSLYNAANNCKNKFLYEICGDHCDWGKYNIFDILFKNKKEKNKKEENINIKTTNKLLPQMILSEEKKYF